MTQRSLRYDDNPMSLCVVAAEGCREGTLLPFSLPRVFVTWVATPCRFVFQLLKQPHIGFAFNTTDKKQEHRVCYFYAISQTLFLFNTRIIKMSMISATVRIMMSLHFFQICSLTWEDVNHKSNIIIILDQLSSFVVKFIKTLSQIWYNEILRQKIHKFPTIAYSQFAMENMLWIIYINILWNLKNVFILFIAPLFGNVQKGRWCLRGSAHTILNAQRLFSAFCIVRRKTRWENNKAIIGYQHVQARHVRL